MGIMDPELWYIPYYGLMQEEYHQPYSVDWAVGSQPTG